MQRWRFRRPHHDALLACGLEDRVLVLRPQDQSKVHAEGQQVAHGDGAVGGYGVVKRPVNPLQHLTIGQFGQQPIHRLVQP
jgi:hypothetical protein